MMSTSYEDTLLDFDLDFLRHTTNNQLVPSRTDSHRTAISFAKKKIIATDILVGKYRHNKELVEQLEKSLLTAKEESKQICIEYKLATEKCNNLEKECKQLQVKNQELEAKCLSSDNRFTAIQSHINQLQSLIKEHEACIQGLKLENQLEKANVRDLDKSVLTLKKEKDALIKHISVIREVIYHKRELTKKEKFWLDRYKKMANQNEYEATVMEEDFSSNDYNDEIVLPTNLKELSKDNLEKVTRSGVDADVEEEQVINDKIAMRKEDNDRDSECSYELVSIDTGRGSSLAFSDSDKCFNSPDYYITDSPLNLEKTKHVDGSTSPLAIHEMAHKSTSPIIFNEKPEAASSNKTDKELVKLTIPKIFVDKAVSPINSSVYIENTQYSGNKTSSEIATSPIFFSDAPVTKDTHNDHNCLKTKDKECLGLNNANNLLDENTTDLEIENILNTMRIHHRLITPIPITPKPTLVETNLSCDITDSSNARTHCGCYKVPQILESQKNLQETVANLVKYVKLMAMNQQPKHGFVEEGLFMDLQDGEDSNDNHMSNKDDLSYEDKEQSNQVIEEDEIMESENDNLQISSLEDSLNSSEQFPNVEKTTKNSVECFDTEFGRKPQAKLVKVKKLTKLEKLRKKLLPKRKIKCVTPPPTRRIRTRSQNMSVYEKNELISLNNKVAFDKAVEIMADIKLKQNAKSKCLKEHTLQKKRKSTEMICEDLSNETSTPLTSPNNSITTRSRSKQVRDKDPSGTCVDIPSPSKRKELNVTEKNLSPQSHENKQKTKDLSYDKSKHQSDKSVDTTVPDINKSHEGKSLCVHLSVVTQEALSKLQNEDNSGITSFHKAKKVCGFEKESKNVSKRVSLDVPETETKRILRSSTISQSNVVEDVSATENCVPSVDSSDNEKNRNNINQPLTLCDSIGPEDDFAKVDDHSKIINYNDMSLFVDEPVPCKKPIVDEPVPCKKPKIQEKNMTTSQYDPQQSLLCIMLEKYGIPTVKNFNRKMSDSTVNLKCRKIEEHIAKIKELPLNETKPAMDQFVADIRNWSLKQFLAGLMKYFMDPERKAELFNQVCAQPAPPMTKSEQIFLYVVTQLKGHWPNVDIVDCILSNIEYSLFKLNRTPEFNTIESMSHFYAVLCRYIKAKSRLRLFMLDAMYCIQYKAVPLIKQCLEVWMHVLPLAHMGTAKTPLVTCLVYLLHFYKCEDKFNRVQDLRNILCRKYFYQVKEWNEMSIIDMFKTAIKEIKDNPLEKKMLRIALIILAKRQGPRWCHSKIIQNMLQPMMEKDAPEQVKVFCVSMMGPLLKPYPIDMRVHCEIIMNQLIDLLDNTENPKMEQAIITSLICMNRHNQKRVVQTLLSLKLNKESFEIEDWLRDFVREKPLGVWKKIISGIPDSR